MGGLNPSTDCAKLQITAAIQKSISFKNALFKRNIKLKKPYQEQGSTPTI